MFYGNFQGENGALFKQSLEILRKVFSRVYANDNLITVQRNVGFLQDPKFMKAFTKAALTTQEKSLGWRLHTLCWAAHHCLSVEGDFVECGVYKGFSFAVVCDYLDFAKVSKKLYLYDTYEGIPEQYNSEGRSNRVYEEQLKANRNAIYDEVVAKFKPYPNVEIVKGIVPDTFAKSSPKKIALLHIDMNAAAAEIAALEHLFDRVSTGGIIIFDDYGWSGYVKQKIAEDTFMAARGDHRIMELPTGQGLLIKK